MALRLVAQKPRRPHRYAGRNRLANGLGRIEYCGVGVFDVVDCEPERSNRLVRQAQHGSVLAGEGRPQGRKSSFQVRECCFQSIDDERAADANGVGDGVQPRLGVQLVREKELGFEM